MSCDLECPLSIGLTAYDSGGPTSKETLLFEQRHTRCWLDAKARPVLIFTPKRHVRRMLDLSTEEMEDLWTSVCRCFRDFGIGDYKSIVANHGARQTHAHLHLKVWLPSEEFDRCFRGAGSATAATLERLDRWASALPMEFQGRWRSGRAR
mmetsp:Transcript_25905/g.61607  ORF Transcript_25905/g.61607 Transcript_25905/m.61607 type:complete len:151 (+) Transcript_25905:502-954(+)